MLYLALPSTGRTMVFYAHTVKQNVHCPSMLAYTWCFTFVKPYILHLVLPSSWHTHGTLQHTSVKPYVIHSAPFKLEYTWHITAHICKALCYTWCTLKAGIHMAHYCTHKLYSHMLVLTHLVLHSGWCKQEHDITHF